MIEKVSDPKPPRGILRAFARAPIYLYRAGLGGLLGGRFLLLIHTGRKTGLKREVVLELVRHDRERKVYVVVSGWGEKADWYRNIGEHPQVEIQVRRARMRAVAERIDPGTAGEELARYGMKNPGGLQSLARLMGYRISQDESDYRALGEYLPVVYLKVNSGDVGVGP